MNRRIRRKLLAHLPPAKADGRCGPDALERFRRTRDSRLWEAAVGVVRERLAKVGRR